MTYAILFFLEVKTLKKGGEEYMPKLIFKQRIVPSAGKHLATLKRIEEEDNKFFDPKKDSPDKRNRYGWVFGYDDLEGMEIRTWSSSSISTYKGQKSRALIITETLLDKQLSTEEKAAFEGTDALIGKKCYLSVKLVQKDGETYAKVESMESMTGKTY